jgi:hypothetical protein
MTSPCPLDKWPPEPRSLLVADQQVPEEIGTLVEVRHRQVRSDRTPVWWPPSAFALRVAVSQLCERDVSIEVLVSDSRLDLRATDAA